MLFSNITSNQQGDTTLTIKFLEINKFCQARKQCYVFFLPGSIIFTSYLRYVVSGDANAPVFKNQASFPGISLRKRLFEIVWYMVWVFGEYPVAVMECCCQDIVGERQRSTVYDF